LNETGTFIWNEVTESGISKGDLLMRMAAEFNEKKKDLALDLDEFIRVMVKKKIFIKEEKVGNPRKVS
jgi:hypothetical protein